MVTQVPETRPDRNGLSWRQLSAGDIDPLLALIEKIQTHDREEERTRRADLETMTRQSWVDLAADSRVAVDAGGTFRAFGRNAFRPGATETVAVRLEGGVDPQWRGRGIGRELLAWQRTRALENIADLRAADPVAAELPSRIGGFVEEQVIERSRLYEAAGFEVTRWFLQLRRSLDHGRDVPPLAVDGLRVEQFGDHLAERVRLAHNDAFLDHWGSTPYDEEAWRSGLLEEEAFRPAQSFVVIDTNDPDEAVVAYVVNCEYEHDWAAQGFTDGYTDVIGVRRPWRGCGLARHLLALSACAFADAGHPYATLDADAENPSGAVALYESVGYEPTHRTKYYSIDV
ncbi:GNAT family N-acetyltransferase [Solicola gregarius]|uniref:GNAT family N-acetyltransferase n=1 Tax=Solicola gregarius TaxID=2908642 RepID=A0AA46YLQ6_9ACTN|nr:GNAT family N-acetyltransferase [Solicola gregarius]UYM05834.1 GNAT family N-acetyltransferase [Solicola gregarius]